MLPQLHPSIKSRPVQTTVSQHSKIDMTFHPISEIWQEPQNLTRNSAIAARPARRSVSVEMATYTVSIYWKFRMVFWDVNGQTDTVIAILCIPTRSEVININHDHKVHRNLNAKKHNKIVEDVSIGRGVTDVFQLFHWVHCRNLKSTVLAERSFHAYRILSLRTSVCDDIFGDKCDWIVDCMCSCCKKPLVCVCLC